MIRGLLDRFEEVVGAVLMAALCLIVGMEVVLRYVMTQPLSWTEELSTIIFVYITMLGASLALKKGEHFAVELLNPLLSEQGRRRLRRLVAALVVAFALILLVYGGSFAVRMREVHTPAMEWPRWLTNSAIPLGGALMLLRGVQAFVRLRPAREVQP